jgi:hypothetical protein
LTRLTDRQLQGIRQQQPGELTIQAQRWDLNGWN